jgi:pre-mRNA-splicing factor RBM22/SLT11
MGEKGLAIRTDPVKQTWELSEFPLLCEKCLGENPYVRMMKTNFDRACRVCDRPFCVYRWRPGKRDRFKKTEVCQICARYKKVCQCCLRDLTTGVLMTERDKEVDFEDKFGAPKDPVNKDYWAQLRYAEITKQKEAEDEERKKKGKELEL